MVYDDEGGEMAQQLVQLIQQEGKMKAENVQPLVGDLLAGSILNDFQEAFKHSRHPIHICVHH